ncbi:flavin monoamine oxidase family protein [Microbulbifer sp. SSSA002]|uniref:flavin monoamine oxidase family protein n=1 Tax=Microbulbifer sp. SSSA002 TaxID=3243376 RepID=UPI00403A0B6F
MRLAQERGIFGLIKFNLFGQKQRFFCVLLKIILIVNWLIGINNCNYAKERQKMLARYESVKIVGAGISGIVCALTLAKSKIGKNFSIKVFENTDRPGGRAHAVKVQNSFVDLGAGRFSSNLHHNVKKEIMNFGLSYEPFPFTKLWQSHEFHKSLKGVLRELKPLLVEHENDSFLDFLTFYIGGERAEKMIDALGYDSLSLPNITPRIAFDIIEKHPETQGFSDNSGDAWYNLEEGFSSLTEALYKQAIEYGVEFYFNHRLMSVDLDSTSPSFTFLKDGEKKVRVSGDYNVLALPPTVMSRLDCGFPQDWSDCTYGAIPLFKGFLFYDSPWWEELGLTDHVMITSNQLRKLYFKGDKYIFFYTDGDCANFWKDSSERGSEYYLKTVKELILDALPSPLNELPDPVDHTCKYWQHGVEFANEYGPQHPLSLVSKCSRIISTSDAYTPHCGWMEGGIMAGRNAAEIILSRVALKQQESDEKVACQA